MTVMVRYWTKGLNDDENDSLSYCIWGLESEVAKVVH